MYTIISLSLLFEKWLFVFRPFVLSNYFTVYEDVDFLKNKNH